MILYFYFTQKEEGHVRLETDNTLSTSHLITVSVSTVCTGLFFALVVWVIATMFKVPPALRNVYLLKFCNDTRYLTIKRITKLKAFAITNVLCYILLPPKNPRKSSDSKRTGEMKEILQKVCEQEFIYIYVYIYINIINLTPTWDIWLTFPFSPFRISPTNL